MIIHSHVLKAINEANIAKNQVLEKGHPGQRADVRQGEATGMKVQGCCEVGTKRTTILEI